MIKKTMISKINKNHQPVGMNVRQNLKAKGF